MGSSPKRPPKTQAEIAAGKDQERRIATNRSAQARDRRRRKKRGAKFSLISRTEAGSPVPGRPPVTEPLGAPVNV